MKIGDIVIVKGKIVSQVVINNQSFDDRLRIVLASTMDGNKGASRQLYRYGFTNPKKCIVLGRTIRNSGAIYEYANEENYMAAIASMTVWIVMPLENNQNNQRYLKPFPALREDIFVVTE